MRKRSAFTLVELLVVMAIILMLAGLLMGAVWHSTELAREAETRSSVRKLANLMQGSMESYDTRRIPVGQTVGDLVAAGQNDLRQFRLNALNTKRVLQQSELPDEWSDVQNAPAWASGVTLRYKDYVANKYNNNGNLTLYQGAECLYMIVKVGRIGSENNNILNQANMSEGDIDGDGLLEFWDGWKKPISWIRRPYAFESKLQKMPRDINDQHDPLDVTMEDMGPTGYGTYPLIYSAGPDSEYGIIGHGDPLNKGSLVGDGTHLDNIHSHNVWGSDLEDLE